MTTANHARFWSRPRCVGVAAAVLVITVFVAANAHLVAVAFSSQPDCVMPITEEGVAYRAAKQSC